MPALRLEQLQTTKANSFWGGQLLPAATFPHLEELAVIPRALVLESENIVSPSVQSLNALQCMCIRHRAHNGRGQGSSGAFT